MQLPAQLCVLGLSEVQKWKDSRDAGLWQVKPPQLIVAAPSQDEPVEDEATVLVGRYRQENRCYKRFSRAFLLNTTILHACPCACAVARLSFYLPPGSVSPHFCLLFPSTHTDHADCDVCTAGPDGDVQETCGLQIPC